ncbi:metastasis-suppressor KiSS-1 precursor [Monodelphis domestica]|uniref:KiSS-1 metastasis suppressor n=1 Tax=Monodelphis domestica TaxID=13616 RepID=B6IDD8_MONDO|nr:metastasis-suppressor KiSS-1 precursor [Monodelphis domestica]DAA06347.1 TPA_inf: kisspeptin [Monodelphis domestica]
MRSSVYWQLLLLLSVSPFGETSDKFAPVENPGRTGTSSLSQEASSSDFSALGQPGRLLAHLIPWEGRPQCLEKPEQTGQTQRLAMLCPSDEASDPLWPGLCPTRSRLITAPQGALLVEREKDMSTYNWNSFGLRYGKRQTNRGKARVPA